MKEKTLTEKQVRAIDLIIKGETLSDVARLVGVSRQTVSFWKNSDELFKAELEKSIQGLKSQVNARILDNMTPLMDKLIKIALKSNSDKTSLDAIIYALNRVCGTPTNKTQDVTEDQDKDNKNNSIEDMLKALNDNEKVIKLPDKVVNK